jgi:hypothetical protein
MNDFSLSTSDVELMRSAMLALSLAWRNLSDEQDVIAAIVDDVRFDLKKRLGRDGEHCECPACREGNTHQSDCAVHNEPAMPNGECNCGAPSLPASTRPIAGSPDLLEALRLFIKAGCGNSTCHLTQSEAMNAARAAIAKATGEAV